jgi:RND family efflux transporter MFP subunit
VAVAAIVLIAAAIIAGRLLLEARQARNLADAGRARDRGRPIPVRTVQVEQSPASKVIGATSLTVPSRKASVLTEAGRRIPSFGGGYELGGLMVKKVLVRHGDPVRVGQVLVELQDKYYSSSAKGWEAVKAAAVKEVAYREQALAANQAVRELDVAKAEAEVKFRTVDIDSRTKIHDALEKLSKTGAASLINFYEACTNLARTEFGMAVARLDVVRAKTNLTIGLLNDQFELAQAVARRDEALAVLEQIQWSAEACRLRSPLDGFVGEVKIVPGEVVEAAAPLMQVFQLDPIWVRMDFPQERIGELAVGQTAEIVIDSYPRETFPGKVVAIMPEARPETRVLPVFIEVSNPGCRIKAGVSGFTRLSVATKPTTAVPAVAVMQDKERATVFCVENGHARLRPIRPGHMLDNGMLEVESGLSRGEQVVIFGHVDLRDGDAVDTDWRKWTRRE